MQSELCVILQMSSNQLNTYRQLTKLFLHIIAKTILLLEKRINIK
jgi:hypothetical protein